MKKLLVIALALILTGTILAAPPAFKIRSALVPDNTSLRTLGTTSYYWLTLYVDTIYAKRISGVLDTARRADSVLYINEYISPKLLIRSDIVDTMRATLHTYTLLPVTDVTYDLGSATRQYRNAYIDNLVANTITGTYTGSIDTLGHVFAFSGTGLADSGAGVVGAYAIDLQLNRYAVGNRARGNNSGILSGFGNTDSAGCSVVAGGDSNSIIGTITTKHASGILSGSRNRIHTASYATISGGYKNLITGASSYSGILAGDSNKVSASTYSAIVGGSKNSITADSFGVIGSGRLNTVQKMFSGIFTGYDNDVNAEYSTVLGGAYNTVTGDYSSIVSGYADTNNASHSVIASGYINKIHSGGGGFSSSVIVGGYQNTDSASYATITGGRTNKVLGEYGIIGGGSGNVIYPAAQYGTVLGGHENKDSAAYTSILGGHRNKTLSQYSMIAGGASNLIGAGSTHAVIMGGTGDTITRAPYSIIASGKYNKIEDANNAFIIAGSNNSVTGFASDSGVGIIGTGNRLTGGGGNTYILGGKDNHINPNNPGASVNCLIAGSTGSMIADASNSVIIGGQYDSTMSKGTTAINSKNAYMDGENSFFLGGKYNISVGSGMGQLILNSMYGKGYMSGQQVVAQGKFKNTGDCQKSTLMLTTYAPIPPVEIDSAELFLDGLGTWDEQVSRSERMIIPDSTTWFFTIKALGVADAGSGDEPPADRTYSAMFSGTVQRRHNTVRLVHLDTLYLHNETDSTGFARPAYFRIEPDNVGKALRLVGSSVVYAGGKSGNYGVRWNAVVELNEINIKQ